jgi:hypothetical protein
LKNVHLILIYVNEAHSNKWPQGYDHQPNAPISMQDRIFSAKAFVDDNHCTIPVFVDLWNNCFDDLFHAWPDKYYLVDSDLKLITYSSYGSTADGVIDKDICVLLQELIMQC